MNSIYHSRGHVRACGRPVWLHLSRYLRDPAYRALHRYAWRLKGVPRYTPARLRFAGCQIQVCDGPSFLSAWDEIFVNRIYDIGSQAGCPLLVDAGANIGLAALYWRWRYGDFRYVGFEPDPTVAACCRANLRGWDVHGELVEAALGRAPGRALFHSEGADGGRLVADPCSGSDRVIEVAVEVLSRRLTEQVDLLKIDVEGAEGEVLEEIAPVMHRVRALFVEWHCASARPNGFGTALQRLEAAGFRVYVQVAHGPEYPFLGAAGGTYEQQLNIFAVRS